MENNSLNSQLLTLLTLLTHLTEIKASIQTLKEELKEYIEDQLTNFVKEYLPTVVKCESCHDKLVFPVQYTRGEDYYGYITHSYKCQACKEEQ